MSFIYRFSSKEKINIQGKNTNEDKIFKTLSLYFKSLEITDFVVSDNTISFYSTKSLINFSYKVNIKLIRKKDLFVVYNFQLTELTKIAILIIIFSAFFSTFSVYAFIVFSVVFTLIFFTINIIFINSYIKQNINKAIKRFGKIGDEEISNEQKEWMKNPLKCPACGADITKYNDKCLECGLKLSGKKFLSQMNISNYNNEQVTYSFNKNKK